MDFGYETLGVIIEEGDTVEERDIVVEGDTIAEGDTLEEGDTIAVGDTRGRHQESSDSRLGNLPILV